MCKFLLERCHARKDQTLETTLYVLIYGSWFEISWFKWVSSWHSGAWRCSMFFIVFAFATIWRYHWSSLHFFPVLWASPSVFLSVSMCICGALQSSTVYLCAGGQRWQCLGGRLHNKLPGWARQRGRDWDIFLMKFDAQGVHLWTRQRGGEGHWLCFRSSGGRGATSFSNLFHGEKTWKNFRSSCEVHVPSHVEYHHNLNESICWVHLQGRYMSISRIARISRSISWKFERLL